MRRGLLLVCLLASLATAAAARPRTRTGKITGAVIGLDGKAVPGARVTLEHASGRSPQTRVTDAEGYYHFRALPVGLYDLRAYAHGLWSEWHHNVLVQEDREIEVDLLLRPKEPVKKR